jgi:hypothetical protein
MALIPGELIPWIEMRWLMVTSEGLVPNENGYILSFEAGTTTPLATYSDSDLSVANPVQIDLDTDGRSTVDIYLLPQGYKFEVYDQDDVLLYTVDDVENVGQTFAANFGLLQTEGSKNVTSGYTVLTDDRLVTVASTGGPSPCIINLPSASDYTGMLCIKNLGTEDVDITPSGVETIETIAAAYEIPAAVSPMFPSVLMVSDGVSDWAILASHGVV